MREIHVLRRCTACTLIIATLALAPAHAARGGPSSASELSALSMLPVAMSVTSVGLVLSGTASLAVVAVEASADGVVWIVERASDGVRGTVRFARDVAGGLSIAAGEMISVVAMGTGWVLCTAGKAIAFVPNEIGSALLYSQRISR
jgi:hypothetical protein